MTITPEMKSHEDSLLNSQGDPTKAESENARTLDSTPEKEAHKKESERTNDAKKENANRQTNSQGNKKSQKNSTKTGTTGLPSRSSKSVESVTARQQVKKGKFGVLGSLALGAGAVMDYSSRVKNGDTPLEAAVGTGANAAMAYLIGPGLYLGGTIAKETVEGAVGLGESMLNKTREVNRLGTLGPFAANRFIETRDTFTMRQAAMAAIGQARGNLENAMIGSEAGMLHR